MIDVKLTRVDWVKPAVFTVVFLVNDVRTSFASIDVDTSVPRGDGANLPASNFNVGKATD